jgi:hypothetical protein
MLRPLVGRFDPGRDASGMIYGTVITAATMVGAAEGSHDEGEIAATVAVTLLVYWIAHAYAVVLGGAHGASLSWKAAGRELAAESPMLAACFLPLAALIVASALGASFSLATSIAVWFAVALLFVWGLQAARRVHASLLPRVVSAGVFGLLGLGIVALRSMFVH